MNGILLSRGGSARTAPEGRARSCPDQDPAQCLIWGDIMDWVPVLTEVISNVGFPIVCCAALFWYVVKHTEKQRDEVDELQETVRKNTEILTELKTLIVTLLSHYGGVEHGSDESGSDS